MWGGAYALRSQEVPNRKNFHEETGEVVVAGSGSGQVALPRQLAHQLAAVCNSTRSTGPISRAIRTRGITPYGVMDLLQPGWPLGYGSRLPWAAIVRFRVTQSDVDGRVKLGLITSVICTQDQNSSIAEAGVEPTGLDWHNELTTMVHPIATARPCELAQRHQRSQDATGPTALGVKRSRVQIPAARLCDWGNPGLYENSEKAVEVLRL